MKLISRVHRLYQRIPTWMLQPAAPVYYALPASLRYGSTYQRTMQLLRETDALSRAEQDTLANDRFLHTVQHAYAHVPFYKRRFDDYGVDMRTIHDLRDITRLPTMDKDTVRNHLPELLARNVNPKSLLVTKTSGTTGTPASFYQHPSITMTEWAYTMHLWARVGCQPDDMRLILRGKDIRPNRHDPDYYYDPLRRELSCSVPNMTDESMEKYCRAIEHYKPPFVHGYMSAVELLCKYIQSRKGGLGHQFRAVLAISETISPMQRSFVEEVLGARVFSFYGHSERLIIAGECEKTHAFHIEPLYGYAELLNNDGMPAQEGELTATGFLHHAMPLIRYRTGDLAQWDADDSPCPCGRAHRRLRHISGRIQEALVGSNGAQISSSVMNFHTDAFASIRRFQYHQDTPGQATLRIVPLHPLTSSEEVSILSALTEKTQGQIRFVLEYVPEIPPKPNGKFSIIDQRLTLTQPPERREEL